MNNQTSVDSPVFLFGLHRGGTTLLQRILNSVDEVTIWGEQGYFLSKIAEAYYLTLEDPLICRNFQEHQLEYDQIVKTTIKNPAHWSAWANWYSLQKYRENFRNFIKSFYCPLNDGVEHWGFKEIRYGYEDRVLEFLKDLYSNARFIFITRDVLDVIRSRIRSGSRGVKLQEQVDIWNKQVKAYFDFSVAQSGRSYLIHYENLIKDDSRELKELFSFLNLGLTEKQLNVIKLKEGRIAAKYPREISAKNLIGDEDASKVLGQARDIRKLVGYT